MAKKMTWHGIKQLALQEANNEYCDCGYSYDLHVHHIKYPGETINDAMVFCQDCHRLFHRSLLPAGFKKMKYLKIFIPEDKAKIITELKNVAEKQRRGLSPMILEAIEYYIKNKGE